MQLHIETKHPTRYGGLVERGPGRAARRATGWPTPLRRSVSPVTVMSYAADVAAAGARAGAGAADRAAHGPRAGALPRRPAAAAGQRGRASALAGRARRTRGYVAAGARAGRPLRGASPSTSPTTSTCARPRRRRRHQQPARPRAPSPGPTVTDGAPLVRRLLDVVDLIATNLEPAALLEQLSRSTQELFGSVGACWCAREGEQMQIVAATGLSPGLLGLVFPVEGSGVGALIATGRRSLVSRSCATRTSTTGSTTARTTRWPSRSCRWAARCSVRST